MAHYHRFTKAQSTIMRAIRDGMLIKKNGTGYTMFDAKGCYVGKASVAVKTLAGLFFVAKAGDRIYFTTRGYGAWFGGAPTGETAQLCALADERVEYVKSMMAEPTTASGTDGDDGAQGDGGENVRTVTIPAMDNHGDFIHNRITVRLYWRCPVCGNPRGEPYSGFSFDGSRRLNVDTWRNPCGHHTGYAAIRKEAQTNGLNDAPTHTADLVAPNVTVHTQTPRELARARRTAALEAYRDALHTPDPAADYARAAMARKENETTPDERPGGNRFWVATWDESLRLGVIRADGETLVAWKDRVWTASGKRVLNPTPADEAWNDRMAAEEAREEARQDVRGDSYNDERAANGGIMHGDVFIPKGRG